MNEKKEWLATYLYYAEPWEKFLVEVVQPFVESAFMDGLSEQFFFIRYWERGPHIRIRFKGDQDILENELRPRLASFFGDYFKRNASVRTEPDWVKNLAEDQQWFPNNSIQFTEYEPEILRYGGPAGILISEKQFEISSRCVLSVLKESSSWDYDRALGAAIQLHLSFASAMGMSLQEAVQFFSSVSKGWLMSAIGYRQDMPAKEMRAKKEAILSAFQESFEKQKSTLTSFHRTLWNALGEKATFEQEWLNVWLEKNSHISEALSKTQKEGRLILTSDSRAGTEPRGEELSVTVSSILESYVHMTNNRLGIMNRDEAYLGYLITNSLLSLESPDKRVKIDVIGGSL